MPRLSIVALALGLLLLGDASARAGQDDPRLQPLFATLKSTQSEEIAHRTELSIWRIWNEHRDPELSRILAEGVAAMSEEHNEAALAAFSEVVRRDANFAEGWNKRATVEFIMGDYDASVADIERTLALEPRHFGALSGLGQIYLALDKKEAALKAFQAALAIDPHIDGLPEAIEELKRALAGAPI